MPRPSDLPLVVVIGPVPPPAFGVATATELILGSAVLGARFRLAHVDTSDRRGLANMGRLDPVNAYLAVKHELLLLRVLFTQRPGVTYLTLSQAPLAILRDWIFVRTATLFGSQAVVHLRGSGYGSLYERGSAGLRWFMGDVFRQADRVLVLGQSLIPMAHSIDQGVEVDVVPNGCPSLRFAPRDDGGDQKAPLREVLYMGALKRAKGVLDALRVAADVVERVPDARFVLAGEWASDTDRQEAEHFVRDRDLGGHIEFTGTVEVDRKAQLLRSASIYLCASHSEGQPWSILEAMSAGVPVVATKTGAIPDTVAEGVTGFVVEVGDVAGLADAVARILSDEALRSAMGHEARRRYAELFTTERSHLFLQKALEKALRAPRRVDRTRAR